MVEIYDEDTLTEFELNRQRNIIKNYEFMKACGKCTFFFGYWRFELFLTEYHQSQNFLDVLNSSDFLSFFKEEEEDIRIRGKWIFEGAIWT